MSIDLNINNYNFNELLNIFKIDNKKTVDKNIEKVKKHCSMVKQKYSDDNIQIFFLKASKIIESVYNLFNNNEINNLEDTNKIDIYVKKIKNIHDFDKYDVMSIVKNISDKFETEKNLDELNNNFKNEIIYDVNSKPLTNLNDKNNTNVIINSFPNSLAPGELNSIKRITLLQNLNLNSCFRSNYYTTVSTDFQYLMPVEVKNVVSIRLASIEIPNAWYLFSSKQANNNFKIITDNNGAVNLYNITIPEGNYDNESLQLYLNSNYFYQSGLDNDLKYIKFSIDTYNFKTKFEIINGPTSFSFTLLFSEKTTSNIMNTAGWILGFRVANYVNINDFVLSEGLFDGSGDRYIYFILNDYQYNTNSTNIVGFDKSSMEENILAKIPMVNGKLSFIISENNNPLTKIRKYNGPVNLKKFHVKVLDKYGNVIDLNYMDFSFTLELELLYESFNFKDVFA
jgi:hypothetical protein